jgi:hypothetical protein
MTAAMSVIPKAGQYNAMEFDTLSSFEDILSDGDVPF